MNTENKYRFKGTLGVWRVQEDADDYTHIVRIDNGHIRNLFLCQLLQNSTGESRANAHLIAAAPELLEACIKMVEACYKHNLTALAPEHYAMQSAIHKALNIID